LREEIGDAGFEGSGDFFDAFQCDVAFAVFDGGEDRSGDACSLGERCLGEALLGATEEDI
jgi:hypothetical protein